MLKLKYLFENFDQARLALAHWPHDEDSLPAYLSRYRISSNAIYPFAQAGRLCFLRLAPREEKLARNLRGELDFLAYLEEQGFPALRPLPAEDGGTLLELDTPWGSCYASAFAAVPGRPLEDCPVTEGLFYGYGGLLARLHDLSQSYDPQTRKWDYGEALDWAEAALGDCGAPEKALRALGSLRDELSALPRTRETYGLVHYDFETDNVFYDQAAGEYAVIDFDDGMYHWYALDVQRVLDNLAELLEGPALAEGRRQFLEGYRARRPFTAEQAAQMPLMRRFYRLFAYARLRRAVAERLPREPAWLLALREKLDGFLRELEAELT